MSERDRLVADRFRLIRRLGAGAMASVFMAEDCELGRRVAIKRLHPEPSSAEIGPRFRREMRVAASLSHPNVVTLYDAIEDDGDVPAATGWFVHVFVDRADRRSVEIPARMRAALERLVVAA